MRFARLVIRHSSRRHQSTNTHLFESLAQSSLPETASHLSSLGLCGNSPVGWIQSAIEYAHVAGGMPWWAAIVTTTLATRIALIPVFIKQQKIAAQLQELKPELDPLQAELKRLKSVGDTVGAKMQAQKVGQLFMEKKVNPLAGLVGLVQVPVFISFFMGVRSMAEAGIPGFKTGGIGIFSDLTACDPTFILPALSSGGMILMMKVNEFSGSTQMSSEVIKTTTWIMSIVGLSVMSFMPIVIFSKSHMQQAIFYNAIPSLAFTVLQSYLLQLAPIRKRLGLSPLVRPAKPTHAQPAANAMLAVRPMTLSEAFKEARKATALLRNSASISADFKK